MSRSKSVSPACRCFFWRFARKKIMNVISFKKRLFIFQRDKYSCQYCGEFLTFDKCSIDHLKAKSMKGSNDYSNLLTCCASCNSSKGSRSIESFRMICRVKKSPYAWIVQGHTVKKLMDIGIQFPLLEEHLFFFELGETK